MSSSIRIALVGDYSPEVLAHVAIPKALELAAVRESTPTTTEWFHTASLKPSQLAGFDGIWCVPGSPYANMESALNAIRFARENDFPFFGTCGGFQHALIEYARNRLGQPEADHAESNPDAALPLIAPLSCGLTEATAAIHLKPGSRVAGIYGSPQITERYNCNYGLNPKFSSLLEGSDLAITGTDQNGDVRIVELSRHPFFFATLFQPERSALSNLAHPLISAFLRAARSTSARRDAAPVPAAGAPRGDGIPALSSSRNDSFEQEITNETEGSRRNQV
jgi:CTP synthase (UTP-ammonia lyase)